MDDLCRVTAMRGIDGSSITGLTYKVGCSQSGGAAILGDVLHQIVASLHDCHTPARGAAQAPEGAELRLAPPRILLVTGRIGTGKTTLLRDMARYLADDCGLSVVVVDTHGDMGGGCPRCCMP
jgi:ABC-type glutathione transport system ATPase component